MKLHKVKATEIKEGMFINRFGNICLVKEVVYKEHPLGYDEVEIHHVHPDPTVRLCAVAGFGVDCMIEVAS